VGDFSGHRIERGDADAAGGGFGLVIAIEMIEIGLADAVLPRDFGVREAMGEEDFSSGCPSGEI